MKYAILSIIIHGILVLFIILKIDSKPFIPSEITRTLSQLDFSLPAQLVFADPSRQEKEIYQLTKKTQHASKKKQLLLGKSELKDNIQNLLTVIHSAIAAKQQYPDQARILHQRGTVTMKFTVHRNGMISNSHIIASSHYPSLDQAAINALQDASPIPDLDRFLKTDHEFTIAIAFD